MTLQFHQQKKPLRLIALLLAFAWAFSLPAQTAGAPGEDPGKAPHRAASFARSHAAVTPAEHATPAELLQRARESHLSMLAARPQAASLATQWTAVGPSQVLSQGYGLITGRVTSLALDPSDATNNTVYVGTSGGGVWKSTNAAGALSSVTFRPLTDTLSVFSPNAGTAVIPSLSIGAISVQPGGGSVVLAGTGDPNDATDSYYGEGVLRSTDGGVTWSLVQSGTGGSFVGEGIAGFAWRTDSPSTVVMAVSSAAEADAVGASRYPGVRGLYYSTNSGQTWTLSTIQDGGTVVQNRTTDYSTFRGNAATAVVWNPIRKLFFAAVRAHGYYQSGDGVTWTRMSNQPGAGLTNTACPARPGNYGLSACPIFRGALAVQPVSGDTFALTVDAGNADGGLWQDTCSKTGTACASNTAAWSTRIATGSLDSSNGSIPQGDYNLALAAVPAATALSASDTLLYVGVGDLYRCSLSGGCTLRNTTNATNACAAPAGVAPSQHAIAWGINLSNSATPVVYLGNDGGLWRSLDGVRQQAAACSADDATHFDNLNGALGSLAEVAAFSSDPTNGNVLLAALGGNGSAASTSSAQATGASPWSQMSPGESGTAAIDQGNGGTWLLQAGGGVNLQACTRGSSCTAADFTGVAEIGSAQVSGDVSLVDPPALLDPALNTNVIVGTCRVWRGPATGGTAWSSSNAISTFLAGPAASACNGSSALVRTLAAGGKTVIANGTQNSGSAVIYAGLAGSSDGGTAFSGHIFVNAATGIATSGTVWTDLTGNAVSNDSANRFNVGGFDVSSIAVDPGDASGKTVYATVQGFGFAHVYRSTNGGSTWQNISANLPDAPANSVVVDPGNAKIVYVAMDTGVYATQDVTACVSAATGTTGSCWSVLGTSLPNAPVIALSASPGLTASGAPGSGLLRAGTYGRGIWQVPLLSAGTAQTAQIVFSPATLSFPEQQVGTTSTAKGVTLTNTGTAALNISAVTASTGFAETDTCSGTQLPAGGTCTLSVTFSPRDAGSQSGGIQVVANVAGGYVSLPLSGIGKGVANITLAPLGLQFGDVGVNTASAAQTVTVRNDGTVAAGIAISTTLADFSTDTTCGATLAAGATCSLQVTLKPAQQGEVLAALVVTDRGSSHVVRLTGSGLGVPNLTLTPALADFTQSSPEGSSRSITLTNSGTATSTFAPPAIQGNFSIIDTSCDTSLAPGKSCRYRIFFLPSTVAGIKTGTFTVTDTTGPHVTQVKGQNYLEGSFTMPAGLSFAPTDVGAVSAAQTITVTNPGARLVLLGVTQVDGDFGVSDNTCVTRITEGASCSMKVIFAPTLDGTRTGFISLQGQYGEPHITVLTGTGKGIANVAVSPAAISFGMVGVGSASAAQTVTLTNSGTAAVSLTNTAITGDFAVTASTCLKTLPAKANCTLSLVFTATAEGSRTGLLTVTESSGSRTVALSGTGQGKADVQFASTAIDFGSARVNTAGATRVVVLNNLGTASIAVTAPRLTGDFILLSTTCGGSLPAGGTCSVSAVFTPSAIGQRSGTLVITDTVGPHTAMLTGTGQGVAIVAFSAASLTFADTAVGSSAATQTVTLSNLGSDTAALKSASITGDFSIVSNTCAATLAAGGSCALTIRFSPTAEGVRTGVLSLADSTDLHTVTLRGGGTAGLLSASTTEIAFPDTTPGTVSAARTVVLTNSGNGPLTLGAVSVTGDFAFTGACANRTLPSGGTCTLTATFRPSVAGNLTGTLSVVSNSSGQPNATTAIVLSGKGLASFNVTLTPTTVDFGTQNNGTVSSLRNITISNTGSAAGALGGISVSGDFSLKANTCGTTLPAQTGCTVSIAFTPTASGVRTGVLTVASDAGTQTASLTGTGTAAASDTLSTVSMSFPSQLVNTASAAQIVTLTNDGDSALTLVSAQVLSGDFSVTNGCGPTLVAHGSCAISVVFAPKSVGTLSGVLQITDVLRAQTVSLSGIATAGPGVSLAPSALSFAGTGVGNVGGTQTLTLTNNGGVPLQIATLTLSGDFGTVAGAGTCSLSVPLPVGGSCTVGIAFLPSSAGVRQGSIIIASNAPAQAAALTGLGVDFTLAANGAASVSVSSGGSAVFPLLLRPAIATTDPVTYACTGQPAYAKCTVTAQYSDLSAISTVTVTVLTGTTAKILRGALLLSLLCGLPFAGGHRRVRAAFASLCLLLWLTTAEGCGSGRKVPEAGDGSTGSSGSGTSTVTTPSGTYNITVTATAAGVTHAVPLTLTVK